MPIWFEVLILALVVYAVTLCAGWMIFGGAGDYRETVPSDHAPEGTADYTETDEGK